MFARKHLFRAAAMAVVCTFLAAMPAMAALDGYITVKGSKQGATKSRSAVLEVRTSISAGEVVESKSQSKKTESGKRQHKPITVVKESDANDALYLEAVRSREPLTEVQVDLNAKSKEPSKLKLIDATIAKIERKKINGKECLEIEFIYREIEWTFATGKTSHQDDWVAND